MVALYLQAAVGSHDGGVSSCILCSTGTPEWPTSSPPLPPLSPGTPEPTSKTAPATASGSNRTFQLKSRSTGTTAYRWILGISN